MVSGLVGDQLVEVDLAGIESGARAVVDHDMFHFGAFGDRGIDNRLQRDGLAAPVGDVGANQNLGAAVVDPLLQCAFAHAGIDHGMHRADARARLHGEYALGRKRHVDDHAVALANAQALQAVGNTADFRQRLRIGIGLDFAMLGLEGQSRAVAKAGVDVAVVAIQRDVGLAADEPLVVGHLIGADFGPLARPGHGFRMSRPVAVGVGVGSSGVRLGILHLRLVGHDGRGSKRSVRCIRASILAAVDLSDI